MIIACLLGTLTGRMARWMAKRKVAIRQDPTCMEMATSRDYQSWREWEANMRNLQANLNAREAAETVEVPTETTVALVEAPEESPLSETRVEPDNQTKTEADDSELEGMKTEQRTRLEQGPEDKADEITIVILEEESSTHQ